MKRIAMICALSGMVSFAGSAAAAELITTVGQGKGGKSIVSFDISTDVELASFNFEVKIPGLAEGLAKAGGCSAELPAGFNGGCHVKNGALMMFANSFDPAIGIGPGLVGVGTVEIQLPFASLAKKGGMEVVSLDAADQSGNPVGFKAATADFGASAK